MNNGVAWIQPGILTDRLYLAVTWPSLNGSINGLQCSCLCGGMWGASVTSFPKPFPLMSCVCTSVGSVCTCSRLQVRVPSSYKTDDWRNVNVKRMMGCGLCGTRCMASLWISSFVLTSRQLLFTWKLILSGDGNVTGCVLQLSVRKAITCSSMGLKNSSPH